MNCVNYNLAHFSEKNENHQQGYVLEIAEQTLDTANIPGGPQDCPKQRERENNSSSCGPCPSRWFILYVSLTSPVPPHPVWQCCLSVISQLVLGQGQIFFLDAEHRNSC